MKMMLTSFLVLMVLGTFENSSLGELDQLKGNWRMKTNKGYLYETWNVVSESELIGNSYRVTEKDSIFMEAIKLVYRDGEVFYIPTVSNQNDGQSVNFRMVSSKSQRFVFENLQHDFPQRIVYHFINSDSLVCNIEGTYNGKEASSYFYFSRMR